jgi:hypothetical protein
MTATDEIVWKVSGVKQLACDRLSNKSRMNSLENLDVPTGWCAGGAVVVQCEMIGLNMFVMFFLLLTSNPFWLIRVATRRG